MSILRTVGGILSIVVGIDVLIIVLSIIIFNMDPKGLVAGFGPTAIYINLVEACLAIVGGILALMKSKRGVGVILVLMAAGGWTLGGAFHHYFNFNIMVPYSLILLYVPGAYWWIFSIEALIILFGGIFILINIYRDKKSA